MWDLQVRGPVHHGGKAWRQGHQVAGHIMSAVRRQGAMNAGAQLSPFHSIQDPAQKMVPPGLCWVFLPHYPDQNCLHKHARRLIY